MQEIYYTKKSTAGRTGNEFFTAFCGAERPLVR